MVSGKREGCGFGGMDRCATPFDMLNAEGILPDFIEVVLKFVLGSGVINVPKMNDNVGLLQGNLFQKKSCTVVPGSPISKQSNPAGFRQNSLNAFTLSKAAQEIFIDFNKPDSGVTCQSHTYEQDRVVLCSTRLSQNYELQNPDTTES